MINLITKYFYVVGSLLFTGYILVIGKTIFSPLLAAFILALILTSIANKIEKYKISRLMSSILSVVLFLSVFLILIAFFSTQIKNLDFEIKAFETNYTGVPQKIQNWVADIFNINSTQQIAFIKENVNGLVKNSILFLNQTFFFATGFLASFTLFIISLFFFLYYRSFLVLFLYQIVKPASHSILKKILNKIQVILNQYLIGLIFVICIIAILNTVGLLILGIKNPIFFGVIGALLTIIPYIGILIGALLPAIFAFITKDSLWYPIGVLIIFAFVQFLEGNFITPNIVGKQLNLNPFAALLSLILGGMLLGLLGIMFALPLLAIFKIICDEVISLKPLSQLIDNK